MSSNMQNVDALIILRVDVSPCLDQHINDLGIAMIRCIVQWREAATELLAILKIDREA